MLWILLLHCWMQAFQVSRRHCVSNDSHGITAMTPPSAKYTALDLACLKGFPSLCPELCKHHSSEQTSTSISTCRSVHFAMLSSRFDGDSFARLLMIADIRDVFCNCEIESVFETSDVDNDERIFGEMLREINMQLSEKDEHIPTSSVTLRSTLDNTNLCHKSLSKLLPLSCLGFCVVGSGGSTAKLSIVANLLQIHHAPHVCEFSSTPHSMFVEVLQVSCYLNQLNCIKCLEQCYSSEDRGRLLYEARFFRPMNRSCTALAVCLAYGSYECAHYFLHVALTSATPWCPIEWMDLVQALVTGKSEDMCILLLHTLLSSSSSTSGYINAPLPLQPGVVDRETILHLSARRGYLRVTQELLLHRAHVNICDRAGNKPIHGSIAFGHRKVTEALGAVDETIIRAVRHIVYVFRLALIRKFRRGHV